MTKETNTDANYGDAAAAQQGKSLDKLDFIEELHKRQCDWHEQHYKTATEKLLRLLADCAEARKKLEADKELRKAFFERFDGLRDLTAKGLSLTSKVIRYVFRITGNRASAYARVIDEARNVGVAPDKLPDWVSQQGGIEAVRRCYEPGKRPAEKFKAAVESAKDALDTSRALYTIEVLPVELHASADNDHDYSLALIKHEKATGRGMLICGSANGTVIKHFLAAVAADVVTAANDGSLAIKDSESLAARTAAQAAISGRTAEEVASAA